MKRTTSAILALIVVLISTNAWWAYQLLDASVTLMYRDDSLRLNARALSQALAVIKVVSTADGKRDEIVSAVTTVAGDGTEPFEKEGYLWVGDLGLRFSEDGRLLEAVPAWSTSP